VKNATRFTWEDNDLANDFGGKERRDVEKGRKRTLFQVKFTNFVKIALALQGPSTRVSPQLSNSLTLTSLRLLVFQKHHLTEPSYLESPSPRQTEVIQPWDRARAKSVLSPNL
jgi:hypothetical protein